MQDGEPLFVDVQIRWRDPGSPYPWSVRVFSTTGGPVYMASGATPGHGLDLALAGLGLITLPGGMPPPAADSGGDPTLDVRVPPGRYGDGT